jgi:hypothetical protein
VHHTSELLCLPSKLVLVINKKTAKGLGLTVPLTLQASANEVMDLAAPHLVA